MPERVFRLRLSMKAAGRTAVAQKAALSGRGAFVGMACAVRPQAVAVVGRWRPTPRPRTAHGPAGRLA